MSPTVRSVKTPPGSFHAEVSVTTGRTDGTRTRERACAAARDEYTAAATTKAPAHPTERPMNYLKDNDDLLFYLNKGIDWATLVDLTEHAYRSPDGPATLEEATALYTEVLEMVGSFVADEIAPIAAEVDVTPLEVVNGEVPFPPKLQKVFDKIANLGLHGLTVPRELGGMNAPMMAYFLAAELMARADVSIMAHHSFHGGIAMAMLVYSLREGTSEIDPENGYIHRTRFADEIAEIVSGKAWGCMDITEPDAGSDMAAIRTRARQGDDGVWRLTGQKVYITSGHGKYHFVIARTEDTKSSDDPMAGLAGLSMFMVPAYEDLPDGSRKRLAHVPRIEHKLGHHASVTAQVVFEDSVGVLIGERGEGFQHMLTLMNNARLGVGFECIGLCESAYRMARDYAAGRSSMGKTIDRHEMIADYLDEMRTDIQALRAICVAGAFHEESAQKFFLRIRYMRADGETRQQMQKQLNHHKTQSRRLTPLLKYFGAEKAVEMARRCIQIHGGAGYTTDYGAEKLLRDALVMPIYEGTSQIQALMAMKDTLIGVMKNPGDFVREQAQAQLTMRTSRDPLERGVARLQVLRASAVQSLLVRTAGNKLQGLRGVPMAKWPDAFLRNWNPKRDFSWAMLHAERLIRILFDEAAAELLLEQAKAHPERRDVLERWLDRAIPRSRALHEEILHTGSRLLNTLKTPA